MIPISKIINESSMGEQIRFSDKYIDQVFSDLHTCRLKTDTQDIYFRKKLSLRIENWIESIGVCIFQLDRHQQYSCEYFLLVFLWSDDKIYREKKAETFNYKHLLNGKYYSSVRGVFADNETYLEKFNYLSEIVSEIVLMDEKDIQGHSYEGLENWCVEIEKFTQNSALEKQMFLAEESDIPFDKKITNIAEKLEKLYESGQKLSSFEMEFVYRRSVFDLQRDFMVLENIV